MKNKGFTLIEMLGVVIIIGIIAIIAFNTFTGNLKGFREDFYSNTERTAAESGKEFFNDNRRFRPDSILTAQKVSIGTLTQNNYVNDIDDYNGDACSDDSYVIIIKESKDDYLYHTCLVCPEDNYDNTNDPLCDPSWLDPSTISYGLRTLPTLYIYKGISRDKLREQLTIPISIIKKNAKGEVLKEVRGNGIDDVPTILPKNIDVVNPDKVGTYSVEYVYTDAANEKQKQTTNVIVYENDAPRTNITYENIVARDLDGNTTTEAGSYSSGQWVQKMTIKFTANPVKDPESKVARYQWNKNGKWQDICTEVASNGSCTREITTEMNEVISFRTVDTKGNISASTNPLTIRIDNTKPTCTLKKTGTMGDNNWYVSDVTISFDVNNDLVPSNGDHNAISQVKISNITKMPGNVLRTSSNNNKIHNTDTTNVEYRGYVEDKAGNFYVCKTTFKRDTTPPVCTVTGDADLKCTDSNGVVSYYWGKDRNAARSTFTTIATTNTFTKTDKPHVPGVHYLQAYDVAGNRSSGTNVTYTAVALPTTGGNCNSLIYNGGTQTLAHAVTGYTYLNNTGKNANIYTVTAVLSSRYVWANNTIDNKTFNCSISRRNLNVRADNKSKIYLENNPTLTHSYSNNVSGEIPGFSGALTTTATKNSNVGRYPIKKGTLNITNNGNFLVSNYNYIFTEGTLTINKRTPVITCSPYSGLIYNGSAQTLGSATVDSGGALTYSNNSGINAGSYTYTVYAAATSNYTSGSKNCTGTIAKKDATITCNTASKPYNGSSQTFGNATVDSGGRITYSSNSGTNAGNYTYTVSAAATPNYNAASKNCPATITRIDPTITCRPNSLTYNGYAQTLGSATSNSGGTMSYQNNSGTDAGSYTYKATTAITTNYNAKTVNCTGTINKAAPSITCRPNSLTYNGYAQTLGSGSANSGGTITYKNNSGTNAGKHTYTVNVAAKGNYTSGSKNCDVTIAKKNATITCLSSTKTYNGWQQSFGNASVDSGGTISYSNNYGTNADTYNYTVNAAATTNYNAATKTCQATINKADTNIVCYGNSLTYNGYAQTLGTARADNGASISYSNQTATTVGTHKYYATSAATTNYNSNTKECTGTISCGTGYEADGYGGCKSKNAPPTVDLRRLRGATKGTGYCQPADINESMSTVCTTCTGSSCPCVIQALYITPPSGKSLQSVNVSFSTNPGEHTDSSNDWDNTMSTPTFKQHTWFSTDYTKNEKHGELGSGTKNNFFWSGSTLVFRFRNGVATYGTTITVEAHYTDGSSGTFNESYDVDSRCCRSSSKSC